MPRAKPHSPRLNRRHPLSRGLVEAWPLSVGGGTTIYGASAGNHTGTFQITDAMGWTTTGGYSAVEFDQGGAADGDCNDYIDLGDKPEFDGHAQMSLAFLVKNHKASISGTGSEFMVTKIGGGADSYFIAWDAGENIDFSLSTAGGAVQATYTDGIPVGEGDKWHLVVGTYDGANMRVYVDGVLGGGPTAQTGVVNSTAHVLKLSEAASVGWDGYMALAAIWKRAITHDEIIGMWVDPFAMFRPRRRVFKAPAAVGGLPIPVAMHHYTKNIGAGCGS